jgi:23S rRNA-/tRNA-specific pseudouridylate synthase
VVGDRRYGDKNVQKNFPRLMLHARAITFRLPSGAPLTIESAAPESFDRVLAQIRAGTLL